MKTIKQLTRLTLLCLILAVSTNLYSQEALKSKGTFVRVYNLEGKKISKGHVHQVNDSILVLKKNSKQIEIKAQDIGRIKTKRSEGNNVLTGAAIGASAGATLGLASAESDSWVFSYSKGEGAATGAIVGSVLGAAIGGITIAFKKSNTYVINGEVMKWKAFKDMISN